VASNKEEIATWFKRWAAAEKVKATWEKQKRVEDCYAYWDGNQLKDPYDRAGDRRAQVNRIHPMVRQQIPALYFYRPYARIHAAPERADTPGTTVDDQAQLLQDTANSFIRDPKIGYRENTFLGLKESFWAMGVVEVSYTASFLDTNEGRPALLETEDTKAADGQVKDEAGLSVGPDSDIQSLIAERERLKKSLREEKFFVKYIPCKQVFVSASDKPRLWDNDWVGYWEEFPFNDVKKCEAYNTRGFKEGMGADSESDKEAIKSREEAGDPKTVRLYKLWDLRTNMRYVFCRGFDTYLLEEKYTRLPLFFLRPDIDPYHFYPRPLLLNLLGPQDEYNDSREYLRLVRKGTRPRWTYDEGMSEEQIRKFESGEFGVMIPRPTGMQSPITPVEQPTYSDTALRTLTLSEKELVDTSGVGGNAQLPQTRTATQAKIGEVKEKALDSYDRMTMADWLGDIANEIVQLAIDYLSLDKWVAVNVAPDSTLALQDSSAVSQMYTQINADRLSLTSRGINWTLVIDMDSLSPVSEQEQLQDWMQGISLLINPGAARLFSVSPELLKRTLSLMKVRSARDQQLILDAMQRVVQMEMMLAAQSQNAQPGVSPQGGTGAPGKPAPPPPASPNPQPGGPAGPGASVPK